MGELEGAILIDSGDNNEVMAQSVYFTDHIDMYLLVSDCEQNVHVSQEFYFL